MYDAELWNMNGPAVLTYAVNMYCDNPSKEPPAGDYFVALKCKNLEVNKIAINKTKRPSLNRRCI